MWRCAALALLLGGACVVPNRREPSPEPEPRRDTAAPAVEPVPAPDAWRTIGTSVEGRPLRARTLGTGPRKVLWIGGIHGNEREGSAATKELPEAFDDAGLAGRVQLTILEDANPDGSAHDQRGNANGIDLNRNFPARNFDSARKRYGSTPLSEPEARAVHDLILRLQPQLVMVAHSWRGRWFINFDGPAEALARNFAKISGFPLVRSNEIDATPGSLGSWVGRDLGVPILTIEWRHGRDPGDAWRETREAILAAIAGS